MHIFAVLSSAEVGDEAIRQLAGLLLKNNIRNFIVAQPPFLPPAVLHHIHTNVLSAIGDASPFVRRTACTCITTLVTFGEIEDCPTLIPNLLALLGSPDQNAVDGAWHALEMITEDAADKLEEDFDNPPVGRPEARPVHGIVLKALAFFGHANPTFRKCAVACIGNVMPRMPQVLLVHMDEYLRGISTLAADPSPAVRKLVCEAIVLLMEIYPAVLMPHLAPISEFMLLATQDADEDVALQAGEFWGAFCNNEDAPEMRPCLQALLPRLVPILLERMVYSQDEIEDFDARLEDDQAVPDRPEEIAPIFHHSKKDGGGGGGGGAGGGGEDDDDDDDDDDAEVSAWTLRKCAANGLDNIAAEFGDEILPLLLQRLQDKLQSTGHWAIRESAILALGAISDGCYEGITEHMAVLYPFLLTLLEDSAPLIRSITCWTLGRYAHWVVTPPPAGQAQRLGPLVETLLRRVLDKNKKVQEAACSAFAVVVEEAQHDILPFLVPILQNLMFAFRKYQTKNLLMMYDAVGTLCESVTGSAQIRDPGCVAILLPPLVEKWHQLADDDRQIFPLLECFTSVAKALGPAFQEYAPPAFARAVAITESVLVSQAAAAATGEDGMDDEFAVCALDLIAGIVEALEGGAAPLVAQPNFLQLIYKAMQHPADDVRQSAFALVGDLCTSCPDAARMVCEQYTPILINNIHPRCQAVCNNSTWATGEMAMLMGAAMEQFAVAICNPLLAILCDPHCNPNLYDNACVTVGRVGLACPAVVAPLIAGQVNGFSAAAVFLDGIAVVTDLREKEHAYQGMCMMLQANPAICATADRFK